MEATVKNMDFDDIEAAIKAEFDKRAKAGKGCFGSLLYGVNTDECNDCELQKECFVEYSNNRLIISDEVETQISIEQAQAEIEKEIEELKAYEQAESKAKRTRKAKTKTDETKAEEAKADETKAEETKAEEAKADETKAEEAKADETKAEEQDFYSTDLKYPVDWKVIEEVLKASKPTEYKQAVALSLDIFLKQGLPEKFAKKNRYRYAQRVFNTLQAQGLLEWSLEERRLTWK